MGEGHGSKNGSSWGRFKAAECLSPFCLKANYPDNRLPLQLDVTDSIDEDGTIRQMIPIEEQSNDDLLIAYFKVIGPLPRRKPSLFASLATAYSIPC